MFQQFAELAPQWLERHKLPHIPLGTVYIRWVPGHTNIPGNEAADTVAKEGAAQQLADAEEQPYSLASLNHWAKESIPQAINKLWSTLAPQQYRDLGIQTSPLNPKELLLPRAILGRILAARSGHGDFAAYHERFNHMDIHLTCRCGAGKAPLHFFFCKIAKRRTRRPLGRPNIALAELLGTPIGITTLATWFQRTRFYEEICPRAPAVEF